MALLTNSALLAVAIGAFVFGRLGDLLGRRTMYGPEAAIMVVGALLSALATELRLVAGRPVHPRHRERRRLPGVQCDHHGVRQPLQPRPGRRLRIPVFLR
ncbi:MFS transporter [Mycobacterium tilburgii]|uniref:MFS transporter n=1 Tax=Mycobacterium tilburgii TaxID=44467 RepID=UPI001181F287|nr:MFS transporter [Mycobacterium tilburgii]